MLARNKLKYIQLPFEITSIFSELNFIKGYECSDDNSLIVWFFDEEVGRQKEVEFSLTERRILSREDRMQHFPASQELLLPDQGVRVAKDCRLELGTDVRYETYEVFSILSGERVLMCEQVYYSPFMFDVADIVRTELQKQSFPLIYQSWSEKEKIDYWVLSLYRLRHRTGETGASEDDVFGLGLIHDMRSLEQGVDNLLPFIIQGLSMMESRDINELIQSFNSRTGMSIKI
ncbi:hypothetical protein LQR31_23385 [Chromobacterium vaccinii]|uniref:hypothetical protein n=1 Tax=Chromobacterium vaccinii TaxID=1108595 RepID=UPI001E650C3C|nr:hypothetical protein [Chromobacterium vaccinii]MCD4487419.1 hypothetical protein [Chromobacterium vaccinii]